MAKVLKLVYTFNTAANLEIEYATGKWVRTTATWFRAFTGPRRVDGQCYSGPVFYEGTNVYYTVQPNDRVRIVSIRELNDIKLRDRHMPKTVELMYPNKRQRTA